jgi:hypothetical protein
VSTPCQTFAAENGFEALDKALFTTERRAAKFIPILCGNCPTDAKADCAKRAESIVSPIGERLAPEGTFGGVFYA